MRVSTGCDAPIGKECAHAVHGAAASVDRDELQRIGARIQEVSGHEVSSFQRALVSVALDRWATRRRSAATSRALGRSASCWPIRHCSPPRVTLGEVPMLDGLASWSKKFRRASAQGLSCIRGPCFLHATAKRGEGGAGQKVRCLSLPRHDQGPRRAGRFFGCGQR